MSFVSSKNVAEAEFVVGNGHAASVRVASFLRSFKGANNERNILSKYPTNTIVVRVRKCVKNTSTNVNCVI